MPRDEDYDSWPSICLERQRDELADNLSIAYLELGLRWLHDRAREPKRFWLREDKTFWSE